MKKIMLLLSATALVTLLSTLTLAASKGSDKVVFTPKMGTVTFEHHAHQKRTECSTCHHSGDYAKCRSCHGVDPKAPKAKNAFHKSCKGCHKQMKKGPTKCKECHIK